MAYLHMSQLDNPFDLIFAASAEEEISGQNGIIKVIEEIGEVDLAIVGEPTGMQMATAEKGLMVIDGLATGVSGQDVYKRQPLNRSNDFIILSTFFLSLIDPR